MSKPRQAHETPLPGFTLLELTVVTALVAGLVTMAVLGLDGLGDTARLRSAAVQLDRVLQLAVSEAEFSGQPRLVKYERSTAGVRLHRPVLTDGRWGWDAGRAFSIPKAARLHDILGLLGDAQLSVWVAPDGTYPEHAVLLSLHEQYAVLLCVRTATNRLLLMDHKPLASTLDMLVAELDDQGTGAAHE